MQNRRALLVFCFCTYLCHAQAAKTDHVSLDVIHAKYNAPFTRNLESFDCAVDFSWKQHFLETTRVGDEGSDEELQKIFQPISNRVTVTRQNVSVYSGMRDDEIARLPHGGMAEFLLEHAVQKSLYTWLPAGTDTLLPSSTVPVKIEKSSSGFTLTYKEQTSEIEMALAPDMRLQSATLKAPQPDRFNTSFSSGPQGFLLDSWTTQEDGNSSPGHRLIFTYTYQTAGGVQLPDYVAINRESHHEVWRYRLRDCAVKTSK